MMDTLLLFFNYISLITTKIRMFFISKSLDTKILS